MLNLSIQVNILQSILQFFLLLLKKENEDGQNERWRKRAEYTRITTNQNEHSKRPKNRYNP